MKMRGISGASSCSAVAASSAFGERLTVLADAKALEAATALQLLAPEIPLIFMGEEVGAREPFLYFTDHKDPKLAQAVRDGRRQEFAKFPEFADEQKRAQIPDPNAPETFERSRPRFRDGERQALYTRLLRLRREQLFPRLSDAVSEGASAIGPKAVLARWRFADGCKLVIASNLGTDAVATELPLTPPIWGEPPPPGQLPPATTLAWIEVHE